MSRRTVFDVAFDRIDERHRLRRQVDVTTGDPDEIADQFVEVFGRLCARDLLRRVRDAIPAHRTEYDPCSRMWFGVGIIGLIIWIAIAFWPARVAGRKGHSFVGYFLLSLLFFPLALIMAYMVQDRAAVAY